MWAVPSMRGTAETRLKDAPHAAGNRVRNFSIHVLKPHAATDATKRCYQGVGGVS